MLYIGILKDGKVFMQIFKTMKKPGKIPGFERSQSFGLGKC
jgi:hypothetical protein